MNNKQKPKNKALRSKNKQFSNTRSNARVPVSYQSLKQKVTPSITVLSTGGFPQMYKWRYQNTSGVVSFPVSANLSTGLSYGFNWPNYQTDKGWSNLSQVYDGYVIVSSYIRVMVFNKSTTVAYRLTTCPYRDNMLSSFPLTSDFYFVDNPLSMTKICGPIGDGSNTIEFSNGATVQQVAGLPKPVTQANDTYCGTVGGANSAGSFTKPLDDINWAFTISSLDGSTIAATTVYATVQILYDIIFFNPLVKNS